MLAVAWDQPALRAGESTREGAARRARPSTTSRARVGPQALGHCLRVFTFLTTKHEAAAELHVRIVRTYMRTQKILRGRSDRASALSLRHRRADRRPSSRRFRSCRAAGPAADPVAGHDGRASHVQDRHGADPRARAGERRRGPNPARAGAHLWADVAPKAALTDAEGRFEFRELPAGRFTLQASKSGFVSVRMGRRDRSSPASRSSSPTSRASTTPTSACPAAASSPGGSSTSSATRFPTRRSRPSGRHGRTAAPPGAPRPAASCRPTISASSDLRPAAGRLLRQRHDSQRRARDDGPGA